MFINNVKENSTHIGKDKNNKIIKTTELSNVIYETTGRALSIPLSISNMAKEMGYEVTFVWIVRTLEKAIEGNRERDRRVKEDHLIRVHGAANPRLARNFKKLC
jgi:predicted peroxiredoxin